MQNSFQALTDNICLALLSPAKKEELLSSIQEGDRVPVLREKDTGFRHIGTVVNKKHIPDQQQTIDVMLFTESGVDFYLEFCAVTGKITTGESGLYISFKEN